MQQEKAWNIPCEDLDYIVLKRLSELVYYDRDLANRLQNLWNQRQSSSINEITLLEEQLGKTEAQIRRLDKLLTDPAVPLTSGAERRYLEMLRDAEIDRQRLTQKLVQYEAQADPVQVIPNFYAVLADFSKEFACLAPIDQKRLMRHVIQDVKLNILTPHLFQLHVLWQNGMATCPDIALLWRGMAPKN
jgi:hypothetical protein